MFHKLFNNFTKKYQFIFIGTGVFFIMLFIAYAFSFGFLSNQHPAVYAMSHWFNQHRMIVILWHLLLFVAIYYGWGWKVDQALKVHKHQEQETQWSAARMNKIKKIKRFRWYFIGACLLIDLIVFW